jgi:hypothetical protein
MLSLAEIAKGFPVRRSRPHPQRYLSGLDHISSTPTHRPTKVFIEESIGVIRGNRLNSGVSFGE